MTTWVHSTKSSTGVTEVDFVFSDGTDILFSDGTDFVFIDATNTITWTDISKNSASWTYVTAS